jgi:hypothetical protein
VSLVQRLQSANQEGIMAGTIDSTVTRKNDKDLEREAKQEQQQAERRRAEDRKEGPQEQAPGEMPPDKYDYQDSITSD